MALVLVAGLAWRFDKNYKDQWPSSLRAVCYYCSDLIGHCLVGLRASIMEPARPAGSTATSEKSLLAEREKERESGAGG